MNLKTLQPTARAAAAALCLIGAVQAGAQVDSNLALSPLQSDDAAVERAFWDCDVQATQMSMPLSMGAQCAALTDELKRRRFGGDFAQLLAWWHANKDAEHARRAPTAHCDTECPAIDYDASLETP
jgi:hypothetical protein